MAFSLIPRKIKTILGFGTVTPKDEAEKTLSNSTPDSDDYGKFKDIDMIFPDEATLETAIKLDESVNTALKTLLADIVPDFEILNDTASKDCEKWLESTNLMYSRKSDPIMVEMLRDLFIYGRSVYQIIYTQGKITKFHRLDPFVTKIIKDRYTGENIVIHDAKIGNEGSKYLICDPERLNEISTYTEIKAEKPDITADINQFIVLSDDSLLLRCINAVIQKQTLIGQTSAQANKFCVIPPIQVSSGDYSPNGQALGLPDGEKLTNEDFIKGLKSYANAVKEFDSRKSIGTPYYVKFIPMVRDVNDKYIKDMLNKYDAIIFKAFYGSNSLWEATSANFKQSDTRKDRNKFLKGLRRITKNIIDDLIMIQFGESTKMEIKLISDNTEELLEESEYLSNIADTVSKLQSIGVSENSLKTIALKFGIELDFSKNKENKPLEFGTRGRSVLEFSQFNDESNKIQTKLTDFIYRKIEDATMRVQKKLPNFYTSNENKTGKLVDKVEKLINDEFDKISYESGVTECFNQALLVTGLNIGKNMDAIQFYQNYTLSNIKTLNTSQKERLKHIILDTIENMDAKDAVKEIQKSLGTSLNDAKRFSRNELNTAYKKGELEYYKDLAKSGNVKIMGKWRTREDGKVCEICKALAYSVTHKLLTLEEIDLLLPRHVNCRCWIEYVFVIEE